ncbi:MAG: hypothetical protein Q4E68_10940, partial [Prevotellaceae bacterium]|nr:hypothetical protein [Prevotellaceae bacterium]
RITETKVSRTEPQQRHRTKWANIVQMWKGLGPELRDAFSNKGAGRSDYNKFVSVNMQRQAVYLAKSQVTGGACVAAPYQITQGSLPAIVITGEGRNAATNIFVADLTLGASTTVSDFSKSVINNNPDYHYGDQISYFLVKQKINEATGIPYCQFKANSVVLDAADDTKLWDIVPKNGFSTVDGCIGHSGNDGDCVFCWVHSRKNSSGKLLVSSQSFVDANSKLSDYTSDLAYNLAASSYGTSKDVFLAPNGNDNGNVNGNAGGSGGGSQGGGDSL